MPNQARARRYAQAVFELARNAKEFDRWSDALQVLQELASRPEMVAYLQSAQVDTAAKRSLLEQVLGAGHPLSINFALLLASRGRLAEVDAIAEEFRRMENQALGIEVAEVTTAVPLSDREAAMVADQLASLTGKKITLKRRVDPEIIGGVVARVGDRLIDGSVATQLSLLRRQLSQ